MVKSPDSREEWGKPSSGLGSGTLQLWELKSQFL